MATIINLFEVNEVELTYRRRAGQPVLIRDETTAMQVLRSTWDSNKIELVEQFKILLLDTASQCLGIADISTGGLDSCVVDTRMIFATALKAKASRIILAHNHPSGNLTPSASDLLITKKLCAAGQLLDVTVLDHFILTQSSYCSLVSKGMMP